MPVFNFDYTKTIPNANKALLGDALSRYNPSDTSDRYLSAAICSVLQTPFDQTDAYRLGIIDEDGKFLKDRSELTTPEEKRAFTRLHVLCFNMRRAMLSGFSPATVGRLTTAAYLLKEETNETVYQAVLAEITKPGSLLESPSQTHTITAAFVRLVENDMLLRVQSPFPVGSVVDAPVFLGEHVGSRKPILFSLPEIGLISEDGEIATNTTSNVDMPDTPVKRTKFANIDVFELTSEDYHKSQWGRRKHQRWSSHVNSEEHRNVMKRFAWKNPNAPIIVKDKTTGAMKFLKAK